MIDRDKNSSNDSLGQCIVELNTLNPEQGIHGSLELADLVCKLFFSYVYIMLLLCCWQQCSKYCFQCISLFKSSLLWYCFKKSKRKIHHSDIAVKTAFLKCPVPLNTAPFFVIFLLAYPLDVFLCCE